MCRRKEGDKDMLSKIPITIEKIKKEDIDKEILRAAIMAELDAINLYEQMAALTTKKKIRTILFDVAKEEKTHVGEFQVLLLEEDKEQKRELKEGGKEVEELLKKRKQ
jgi:rubrerythrin